MKKSCQLFFEISAIKDKNLQTSNFGRKVAAALLLRKEKRINFGRILCSEIPKHEKWAKFKKRREDFKKLAEIMEAKNQMT